MKDKLLTGRLQEHGQARYQFRPTESMSYYVKLLTERGEQVLWGQDLARAIQESRTKVKIGDRVGARRVGREPVTISQHQRNSGGSVVSQTQKTVYRAQWVVEKAQFFVARAQLARRVRDAHADARSSVRRQPELLGTFLSMRGAEAIAERMIANPEDREKFVALVREAIAGSVQQGAPMPVVRMQEKPKVQEERPAKPPVHGRDEPTR